jgi:(p)ppGpp synthase/HD superfamily hydrolase
MSTEGLAGQEAALTKQLWEAKSDKKAAEKIQKQLFAVRSELAVAFGSLPPTEPDVAAAKKIAEKAHAGQVDKVGAPYIGHVTRVAGFTSGSPEEVAAGFLHDSLEDGPFNEAEPEVTLSVIAEQIAPQVAVAVFLLTKVPGQSLDAYYARIKENPLATAVKLADLADNTDPDRLAVLPQETQDRLTAKYAAGFAALS